MQSQLHPKVATKLDAANVKFSEIVDVEVEVTKNFSQFMPRGEANIYVLLEDGRRVKISEYAGERVNTYRSRASMSAELGEIVTTYATPEELKSRWCLALGI